MLNTVLDKGGWTGCLTKPGSSKVEGGCNETREDEGVFEKQQQPFADQEREGQSRLSQVLSRNAWPGDKRVDRFLSKALGRRSTKIWFLKRLSINVSLYLSGQTTLISLHDL